MDVFDLYARISVDTSEYERGLDRAQNKTHGFSEKSLKALKNFAKGAAAAVGVATAAVGAFAISAIKEGAEFDSAMSQVAATMGTTVDKIQNLRDFAMEMGAKTAFSSKQAAEALNYMALAGYNAEQAMEALPNVLNLAAAGGIDLAYASDMVTDAQSALGLTMEESAELVGKMAKASSRSNTSVAQLGEAILTVGGTAKILAGGTTELATSLGILADNGIKGAEGGTALRNIIMSLTAPTDKAAKTMKQLGIEVFDAEGNMRPLNEIFKDFNVVLADMSEGDRMKVLNEIFNKYDMKSVNALLGTSAERWIELAESIDGAWYSMESLSETLKTVGIDLDKMKNSLSAVGVSEEEFSAALNKSGGDAKEFAKMLLEGADSGITYDDVLQAMGGDLVGLQVAFNNTTGAAEAMAATQLDNLAGDITIFNSALSNAKIIISDVLSPALREFVQFGTASIQQLSAAFQVGGLSGSMETLGSVISDALSMIVEKAPDAIQAGVSLLSAVAYGIISSLPEMVNAAVSIITTLGDDLKENLPTLIPTAIEMILEFVEMILDNMDQINDASVGILEALGEGIINSIPILLEKAPIILAKLVGAILDLQFKMRDAANGLVTELGKAIIDFLPEILTIGYDIVKHVGDEIIDNVSEMDMPGKQIIIGLWEGISSYLGWLRDKVTGAINMIKGWFTGKDGFDVHSPSKWAKEIGAMVSIGLAKGIDSETGEVKKSAEQVARDTYSTLKEWADRQTKYLDLSYGEQVELWQEIQSQFVEGSEQFADAEEKIFDLREQAASKYQRSLESRTNEILNWYSLFDAVPEKAEKSGDELLANLQGQVDSISGFFDKVSALAERDGVGQALVDEIKSMGPEAMDELDALLAMSDEKLAEYAALFEEKANLAQQYAMMDIAGGIGTGNVDFASSAMGQSTAAIVNGVSGGGSEGKFPAISLAINLLTGDAAPFAKWLLPDLIAAADAAGTPIASGQYA